MTGELPGGERVAELLTERAVFGLSESEQRELNELAPELDGEAFELAAAAAHLAMTPMMPLPAAVRKRLEVAAEAFLSTGSDAGRGSLRLEMERGRGGGRVRWAGWVAAAACLALAATAWWPSLRPGPTAEERRAALVSGAPDLLRLTWGDFNSLDERREPPEVRGVTGDVVWSDARQEGVLTFRNLPPNDPSKERYQLWIVDAERGLSQRVDGGVFDVARPGEAVIAFRGKLPVSRAIGFAVTIEEPDGVVVSDMSRRVVLALKS